MANAPETAPEKVTMTKEQLDELIAKAKAEGEEAGKKAVPAQGLSAKASESEDFLPSFTVPEGWETYRCPVQNHEDIRTRESIVEPGKPMYKFISDDPKLTRGSTASPLLLWIRRIADGEAMNNQAARDAHEIVNSHNRNPGTPGGIAQVQSIDEVVVLGGKK